MVMDNYQKGWALRYIREAKAQLKAVQKSHLSLDFILDASRKAQAAIYYSLGDPAFIDGIVRQACDEKKFIEEPVLRCLVEIERTLQRMENLPISDDEKALEEADEIIKIASKIVNLFTSKD